MRFKCLFLFVIAIVILTSCSTQITVDETQIPVIDERDYLAAPIVETAGNQVRFKKTISFSQAYPNATVTDLSDLAKPRDDANPICIDNQGILYYVAERGDPMIADQAHLLGAIYSYNPFNQEWKTLVESDENHNCTAVFANEKYLLWEEDENANWQKVSLHVLDLETMKDTKVYTFSTDPNTGLMYAWQFSVPVLIDDTIYFEDIVGMDENGLYKIKMLAYSISKNKIRELDEDAKWPMEYRDGAAWLKMSQDTKNSLFFSAQQKECLVKTETRLGTVFTAKGDLIVANDYLSNALYEHLINGGGSPSEFVDTVDNPRIASYGIKVLANEQVQPVLVVEKGFVSNPVTNGDLVGWYGSSIGAPMMYSYSQDALIQFDPLPVDSVMAYKFILSEKYAYLRCSSESNERYACIWNLSTASK